MNDRHNGFTLIEVLLVVALLGVLALIALPQFSDWRKKAQYRQAARDIASTLREARSKAIAANLEHLVEIDLAAATFTLKRGDRPYNSSSWPTTFPVVKISEPVGLKSGDACDQNSDVVINFYPNGTFLADPDTTPTICVRGTEGTVFFTVKMDSAITGRVVVE